MALKVVYKMLYDSETAKFLPYFSLLFVFITYSSISLVLTTALLALPPLMSLLKCRALLEFNFQPFFHIFIKPLNTDKSQVYIASSFSEYCYEGTSKSESMCLTYNRLIIFLYQSHPFALLLLMIMALLSRWTAKLETKAIFTFPSI